MRGINFQRPSLYLDDDFAAVTSENPLAGYVYLYLMGCPDSNITGLFAVFEETISRHTGISVPLVKQALGQLEAAGFVRRERQYLWLPHVFADQVGGELKEGDNRNASTANYLKALPVGLRLTREFIMAYGLQGREQFGAVLDRLALKQQRAENLEKLDRGEL